MSTASPPRSRSEALRERVSEEAAAGDGFFDGYGDAGFAFAGAHVDRASRTVRIRVIGPRPDHAAYVAARSGPLVRTELIGDRFECARSYAES